MNNLAKFSCFELDINGKELIDLKTLSDKDQNVLKSRNVIYIYKSTSTSKLYIGQTRHFIKRHQQHFYNSKTGFDKAKFDKVIVLFSSILNGSALDDIENQLITYFIADKNKNVDYNHHDVINLTNGNKVNPYSDREKIASDIILPFWEKNLYPNWVNTPTINEIRTKELVKYSPIKTLTEQQINLLNKIITNYSNNYVINGDAGTGKTVLLTHLIAKLLENPNKKIAAVLQPNWIKTAKNIFKVFGLNAKNLTLASSTQLINSNKTFDIIIVDEAHKLSRKHGKQMHSFNAVYKGEFENENNHLDCLKKIGNQIVLMYDVLQAIRPANITRKQFIDSTKDFNYEYLTTQFRIQAPDNKKYTSEDYINGIKYLLYKDTGLLEYTNFNPNFDTSVFKDTSEDSYFGFFEKNPLHNLFDWIEEDRNYHPEHINRVLGGLVEPWKQKDGKDPSITHWHENNLKRRWNSTQENWINSKDFDAQDQVGSVFAVQGIDLNKVGVLLGNDLQVNEQGKLYGDESNFHNTNGKFSKKEKSTENDQEFTLFILNIYYILLTRGIDGIRLGFWRNKELKKYVKDTLYLEN